MIIDDKIVIDGCCLLINQMDGECNLTNVVDGVPMEIFTVSNHTAYFGPYDVDPSTTDDQLLETANKLLIDDINVRKIQYVETSNEYGYTVYIGGIS